MVVLTIVRSRSKGVTRGGSGTCGADGTANDASNGSSGNAAPG